MSTENCTLIDNFKGACAKYGQLIDKQFFVFNMIYYWLFELEIAASPKAENI